MSEAFLKYMKERFGIGADAFSGLVFEELSKGRLFAYSDSGKLTVDRTLNRGLPMARIGSNMSIKPTTVMIQLFGKRATENVVQLTKEQAESFAKGEETSPETDSEDGYVITSYNGVPLGCGHLNSGRLRSMVPKAKRSRVSLL